MFDFIPTYFWIIKMDNLFCPINSNYCDDYLSYACPTLYFDSITNEFTRSRFGESYVSYGYVKVTGTTLLWYSTPKKSESNDTIKAQYNINGYKYTWMAMQILA